MFLPNKMKACLEYLLSQQRTPAPGGLKAFSRVLWYADFTLQRATGNPITGAVYTIREGNPYSRSVPWAIDSMVSEGIIAGGNADYLAYDQADFRLQRTRYTNTLDQEETNALQAAFDCVFADGFGEGRFPAEDIRELALHNQAALG
ncbi:hypothetical protein [Alcaligenes endophyticus]|uniref:Antitoxin SocA-like Panacea domain-containing protein n=1 Tax=Alcaligenes endophyticus TaxID=1929088 RepID=A0ABT8EJ21_9BURK|nr:hypothetical protein [Alcaligenes endophyticus]MCX5592405.1 hypothetical protein [Alcaligenes endophyticus]MDN4121130.1 hypothetical protein [Alcaligenes endophyticus]